MADLSVRNPNAGVQQMTDALLRAGGGTEAVLLVAPVNGDGTDAGQLGLDAPNFQGLTLSPAIFRRTRAVMQAGQPPTYELLISATAVTQALGDLELVSAGALFAATAGVEVAGEQFVVANWACTLSMGLPMLYRLMLRAADPQSAQSLA